MSPTVSSKLIRHLKTIKMPTSPSRPVWKGPEKDGITSSLLTKFLICRERFRVLVVEGFKPVERWNHRTGYGDMWHVCEEAWAKKGSSKDHKDSLECWDLALADHCHALEKKYPLQREEIDKWWNVCLVQFPLYVEWWDRNPIFKNRTPIVSEFVFDQKYKLPSGRLVRLRGKWDSVDKVAVGSKSSVWLQENKTKGDVDEIQLRRQLTFDLQTMLYLTTLQMTYEKLEKPFSRFLGPIAGVRYNVVRRPLSGGKGTIVQHKPSKKNPMGESKSEYYARLAEYIKAEPATYFFRWETAVTSSDIARFQQRFLTPILEQLCDWWQHIQNVVKTGHDLFGAPFSTEGHCAAIHWQTPYGIYSPLLDGGSTDLDEYLNSGSEAGLRQVDNLFPEL